MVMYDYGILIVVLASLDFLYTILAIHVLNNLILAMTSDSIHMVSLSHNGLLYHIFCSRPGSSCQGLYTGFCDFFAYLCTFHSIFGHP